MWTYHNPVNTVFGRERFASLSDLIGGRRYALVTYSDAPFEGLAAQLAAVAGAPTLAINDVSPNPDYELLRAQTSRFSNSGAEVDVVVALGGGSVIDSAKVFAAAGGDFDRVAHFLETKDGADAFSFLPIIAVPTTAGTGSEVTCWATVWNEAQARNIHSPIPGFTPKQHWLIRR